MSRTTWLSALALATALTATPALAASDAQPSPRMQELARKVLDQTALLAQARQQLVASLSKQLAAQLVKEGKPAGKDVTDAFARDFTKAFDARSQGLINQLVPIMAKDFTEEELDALVKFYSSPLGASVMKKMPGYLAAANAETSGWMRAMVPAMLEETKKALQAQGIALPD